MTSNELKIARLVKSSGQTLEELMESAVFDGVCMGICMNEDCDYTTQIEPDQREGYCEVCDTNTVKSILILTGAI